MALSDPFRDDEELPDAQVIICVVDCIDTLLSAEAMRQRTTTQQRLIQGDESTSDMAKFGTLGSLVILAAGR